jgi:hypothetical protein
MEAIRVETRYGYRDSNDEFINSSTFYGNRVYSVRIESDDDKDNYRYGICVKSHLVDNLYELQNFIIKAIERDATVMIKDRDKKLFQFIGRGSDITCVLAISEEKDDREVVYE